jgi:hypothetical protein
MNLNFMMGRIDSFTDWLLWLRHKELQVMIIEEKILRSVLD